MKTLPLLLAALAIAGCKSTEENTPEAPEETGSYTNPVIADSVPDPSVIKDTDGTFYLVGTEDIWNMNIYKSSDLVSWSCETKAFSASSHPSWIKGGMLWAPEINYIDGKYVIYYTLANADAGQYGIGAAYSTTPLGPYIDKGKIIQQGVDVNTGGITIDQFFYSENGHNYMFYGCYGGIYWFELSQDGLSKISEGEPKKFAGADYEGSMIHKRGDYYYYFGSLNGYTSNYQLAVSRSKSLFGPYTNKKGVSSLMSGGYEIVMTGNSTFSNTGHCSKIFTDDKGTDWIMFHAYTTAEGNSKRHPHLYRVTWTKDGWPVIGDNGYPADCLNYAPYFEK